MRFICFLSKYFLEELFGLENKKVCEGNKKACEENEKHGREMYRIKRNRVNKKRIFELKRAREV
ncbi:MAG: hypothetical protein AB9861_12230 [Methanosarcina sp.]|jgi:hypothetical protein